MKIVAFGCSFLWVCGFACGSLPGNCVEGEEHGEGGSAAAFPLAASEAQGSMMPVDDLAADPKAEAGAVDSLGGVEGLEDAAQHRRGHTAA